MLSLLASVGPAWPSLAQQGDAIAPARLALPAARPKLGTIAVVRAWLLTEPSTRRLRQRVS